MDWKILESSVALAANLARDLLNSKISDEKEKQQVENFIEENPVKAAEILPENTPIQNEAIQAIEGGNGAEVNNEVVDDFIEDTWKFNEDDWKEDDDLPPLSKEEGEAAIDEALTALTGFGFKEDIPVNSTPDEEPENKEKTPGGAISLNEGGNGSKPIFEDIGSIDEQTVDSPTVTTSDFEQPKNTVALENNINTSSGVTPTATATATAKGSTSISSNLDNSTPEEEKAPNTPDAPNGSTFNDEESKPISLQHITNAPGAVIPTSTWAKPSEANGDFKVKSSDLPQMEGTKVQGEGIDALPKADLALLENNIRKTPLNIFRPLKVILKGDDVLVDGTPLQDCSTPVLKELMEKVNA